MRRRFGPRFLISVTSFTMILFVTVALVGKPWNMEDRVELLRSRQLLVQRGSTLYYKKEMSTERETNSSTVNRNSTAGVALAQAYGSAELANNKFHRELMANVVSQLSFRPGLPQRINGLPVQPHRQGLVWNGYMYVRSVEEIVQFKEAKIRQNTTMVILLAYQRTGSTLIGNIFNRNPYVHYIYEPLNSAYMYMYGVQSGWTVPSDIFHLRNGSTRTLPETEKKVVIDTLEDLLTCNTDKTPIEVIANPFMSQFHEEQHRLASHIICTAQKQRSLRRCQIYYRALCPERFGSDHVRHEVCRTLLAGESPDSLTGQAAAYYKTILVQRQAFTRYNDCRTEVSRQSDVCRKVLSNLCLTGDLRAVKTVRLNMETAGLLLHRLASHPTGSAGVGGRDLRIIHLVRDPRAVATSRMGHISFRGIDVASPGDAASTYCADLLADVREREKLEKRFPGKIHELVYEDFVKDSRATTESVYKFLGYPLAQPLQKWLSSISRGRDFRTYVDKWRRELNETDVEEVVENCKEIFELYKEKWPSK